MRSFGSPGERRAPAQPLRAPGATWLVLANDVWGGGTSHVRGQLLAAADFPELFPSCYPQAGMPGS